MSSLSFERVIGPLGNPVDDGLSELDDDEGIELERDDVELEDISQETATHGGASASEGCDTYI